MTKLILKLRLYPGNVEEIFEKKNDLNIFDFQYVILSSIIFQVLRLLRSWRPDECGQRKTRC